MLIFIIFSFILYLVGSFPTSHIIGEKIYRIDILKIGSKHSGLSNIYQYSSKKIILLILLIDVLLKGFVPTYLVFNFYNEYILASLFLIIGHNWSFFLNFRGGKGLSISIGLLAGVNIFIFFILVIFFLLFWIIVKLRDSAMPWILSFIITVLVIIFDALYLHVFFQSLSKMSLYSIIFVLLLLLLRRILVDGEYINFNRRIILNRIIFDRDEK